MHTQTFVSARCLAIQEQRKCTAAHTRRLDAETLFGATGIGAPTNRVSEVLIGATGRDGDSHAFHA